MPRTVRCGGMLAEMRCGLRCLQNFYKYRTAPHREVGGARVVLLRAAVPGPERATGWFASRRRPASWTPPNRVEDLLDNRPRKALDYRTPAEVFKRTLTGGPAPLKRNLTWLPARLAGARSRNGPVCTRAAGLRSSCAAASHAGPCSGIAGHGQTTCRPGGRRPGEDFSPRQGRSPGLRPPCGERPCRPGALTHRLGGLA